MLLSRKPFFKQVLWDAKNKTNSWLLLCSDGLETSQATKSWFEWGEEEVRGRLGSLFGELGSEQLCLCMCACMPEPKKFEMQNWRMMYLYSSQPQSLLRKKLLTWRRCFLKICCKNTRHHKGCFRILGTKGMLELGCQLQQNLCMQSNMYMQCKMP